DAHYNLPLVLKVTHRDAEATPEFEAAARSGHAGAQYFAGTAYARGFGVEPNLTQAIAWWSRAAAQGSTEAAAALAELRQAALGRGRPGAIGRRGSGAIGPRCGRSARSWRGAATRTRSAPRCFARAAVGKRYRC